MKDGDEATRTIVKAIAPGLLASSFENDWENKDPNKKDAVHLSFSKPLNALIEPTIKDLFLGSTAYCQGISGGKTSGLTVFVPKNNKPFPERMAEFFRTIAPTFNLEGKITLEISQQTLVCKKEENKIRFLPKTEP